MQTLDLVDRRWDDLLNSQKLDTIRWNEGSIEPGFLVYQGYPDQSRKTVVFVTDVRNIPLRDVLLYTKDVERKPDTEALLSKMQAHYPSITLDTEVLYVQHLSPVETAAKFGSDVEAILEGIGDP